MTLPPAPDVTALRAVDGLLFPGDPAYEELRTPWNLVVDQRPLAVAAPETIADVARIVGAVAAAGVRIAAQSSGHSALPLSANGLEEAVLLRLHRLLGVEIDAERRIARVLGGTLWREVINAAAPHGLTARHGSAGDVAVAGYTLGGGLSFYGRTHGLAGHHVSAIEVVTAGGDMVRATADAHSELFWALRGGGGNFGAVVAIELDLLPIPDVQAGFLLWDLSAASTVVPAWRDWTQGLDPAATSTLRILRFPPIPELPPFLSGRAVVIIDGAVLADDERTAELLQPLRDLAPEIDTFGRMPAAGLLDLHMDPPVPSPGVGDHAMLSALPDAAVEAFLQVAGAADAAGPMVVELRHLGGVLFDVQDAALSHFDAEYALMTVDMVPVPELYAPAIARTHAIVEALRPWADCAPYLNFAEHAVDTRHVFGAEGHERLHRVRATYDPAHTWIAAHPL